MLTCDTSKLNAQLEQLVKEIKLKLKGMVVEFSYRVALEATENTPLGNSNRYFSYYQRRTDLPKEEGIARGNWQYSEKDTADLILLSGRNAGIRAAGNVHAGARYNYQIGDTYYIVNSAPYIMQLENNYSPQTAGQGIMKPTIEAIRTVYSHNLKNYYDGGF